MTIWKRLLIIYCVLSMGYQYTYCAAEACVSAPIPEPKKTIDAITKAKVLAAVAPLVAALTNENGVWLDFLPDVLWIVVLEYAVAKPKPVPVFTPSPYATITRYRRPARRPKRKQLSGCQLL